MRRGGVAKQGTQQGEGDMEDVSCCEKRQRSGSKPEYKTRAREKPQGNMKEGGAHMNRDI